VLEAFKGRGVSKFETNRTFFWVEKKGVRVCDLVRRVRSLDAIEKYFCEGSNRNDFYEFLVIEYHRRSEGRVKRYQNGLRSFLNLPIKVFKLGAELKGGKIERKIGWK